MKRFAAVLVLTLLTIVALTSIASADPKPPIGDGTESITIVR